uniref:Glutathione S-transferase rho n=1 Tax=Neogobius melanostomus TaxID=47308 RepID=A0A8C6THB0_9GOBI
MAKDMTLLWGSGSPPCWRVQVVLEEKNLQGYNSKQLGQVSSFSHGNLIINESIGICEYLADRFKDQGTKLVPDDYSEKAMMFQRMHEGNSLMMKAGDVIYYNFKVPEAERHESALQRNKEALTVEVKLWEDYLTKSKGQYLVGKDFTLADAVIYPAIAYLFPKGLCEKKYPKLAEYYKNLKTRPSIQKTWPPTWFSPPGLVHVKDFV